ncbi:hypothetical protein [Nisaea denitrificans]|uniref:hypothetical protein n=1 Tax=Nisaea denitrificans TaxID=390877 RepID=UPI00196A0079|nr:hypothetical protein [Nisaea denitrificans]
MTESQDDAASHRHKDRHRGGSPRLRLKNSLTQSEHPERGFTFWKACPCKVEQRKVLSGDGDAPDLREYCMSRWTTRRPECFGSIAEALPNFTTRSCKLLATGYASLIERGDGGIPPKNGLDITDFAPAMANVALTAVTLGSACIFRIAGEALLQRFGQNLVGVDYYKLVDPVRRGHAMRSMELVVSTPCGFRTELLQRYDNGEEHTAEACAFPLRSDEPGIDGFIFLADEQLDQPQVSSAIRPCMIESVVTRRDFIDLGFGTDTSYEDLVPRDAPA